MNKEQLRTELDKLEIEKHIYSIDGSLKPNTYVLFYSKPKWYTFFYDEHGTVEERKSFSDEEDACVDLLERVVFATEWQKKNNLL